MKHKFTGQNIEQSRPWLCPSLSSFLLHRPLFLQWSLIHAWTTLAKENKILWPIVLNKFYCPSSARQTATIVFALALTEICSFVLKMSMIHLFNFFYKSKYLSKLYLCSSLQLADTNSTPLLFLGPTFLSIIMSLLDLQWQCHS